MELERFVSAIVRQTTVLIARLSTSRGMRSPLAHVADQVFLGLVNELERQGVGKKVVADMFGLALRSYQLKLQRLQESASEAGVTLWSAVKTFIDQQGGVSRTQVLRQFERDDEATVRSVLADLVESGLVSRTGRGDASVYRATPRDDLTLLASGEATGARAALVWLTVCREGPVGHEALAEMSRIPLEALDSVLGELLAEGRIARRTENGGVQFTADRCLIPLGDSAGWEAALLDHHQAVLNAIAGKVSSGTHSSSERDQTGGATFSFELWPGHPEETAVRGLLARLRKEAAQLWERASLYNAEVERPRENRFNVTFYLGQHLRSEAGPEEQESGNE
jgi:hypothetical protein